MKALRIRWRWLWFVLFPTVSACADVSGGQAGEVMSKDPQSPPTLTLSLAGDVMTGRGVDQALPQSVEPALYESYVKSARGYLRLAEQASGEIAMPVDYDYVWGDALDVWKRQAPDLNLINLETSVTTSDSPWPGKGIHYRMHPVNIEVLTAAGVDYCSLANNHVLDWGRPGLLETMSTLGSTGIAFSGAGKTLDEARQSATLETSSGRVLVFAYGSPSSGIPSDWAAQEDRSGVNFLSGTGAAQVRAIKGLVERFKREGDIVVLSIHWGGNWGYQIPAEHRQFAHRLIDEADVDLIHGHSSHHPKGIEVHRGKLIVYGAGDLINDYEGIGGHERFRPELSLLYFPSIDAETGELRSLKMIPMRMRRLRLNRASHEEAQWLKAMLSREGQSLGTKARLDDESAILLQW